MLGDWQPIEEKYRLSRAMLAIAKELNFRVVINEKLPLLVRDLDLLATINLTCMRDFPGPDKRSRGL